MGNTDAIPAVSPKASLQVLTVGTAGDSGETVVVSALPDSS